MESGFMKRFLKGLHFATVIIEVLVAIVSSESKIG